MSYRTYNTRNTNSGRFNNSGQFVSAEEQVPYTPTPPAGPPSRGQGGAGSYNGTPRPAYAPTPVRVVDLQTDVDMRQEEAPEEPAAPARPAWMKSKLEGVKKITKKERRRRQNNNLRRLITPKNALMVLNEMVPGENVAANFTVEQGVAANNKTYSFCADLLLDGVTYKGFGENKLMARNHAAEQAIRDLILKKMNNAVSEDGGEEAAEGAEPLPMLQIASFALHKLFTEWEYDGHKVPARKQPQNSESSSTAPTPAAAKPERALPVNAAQLHPCMLLTYMRPNAAYRAMPAPAQSGPGMQQPCYTMAADVDGDTWTGTASNKKEARRLAAKAVCEALFGVQFDQAPSSNVPLPPQ